ncbi:MAG: hypothetical protein WCY82_11460 [Desulfotomaculaceae bacterium]
MNVLVKNNNLIWVPRFLTIVFILFISLFSLDAFSNNDPYYQQLINLSIHVMPALVPIAILLISWSRPLISGLLYITLSIIFTLLFKTYVEIINFLVISLPLIAIGALFIISYFLLRDNH